MLLKLPLTHMTMTDPPFLDALPKLSELDTKLLELLRSLTPAEWENQTVAKLWLVKDVAAHLLDGNMRVLSMLRDQYFGEAPPGESYEELLDYLNQLNADWVRAMKRVSPAMLILLHEITGPLYCKYNASLDPFDKASFSVAWAGENESKNWMHIAREYTEKFLHQQQIRDAVNKPGIMTPGYYPLFLDICMLAMPYTYRNVQAPVGSTVQLEVTGEAGGSWWLTHGDERWELSKEPVDNVTVAIRLGPDDAWKLFSKSVRPHQLRERISITGDHKLGEKALSMVSFMA